MKTWELKAEPMTTSQLDRWLSGRIPRRHLAIPFGGPVDGRDIDGEFFDEATDLYGPLKAYGRERLVDWHHITFAGRQDPVGNAMKGAILGRIVLDAEASTEEIEGDEFTGIWADFWANAGEKRRALVAALEKRSVPLYGSSQALAKATRIDQRTGHIDVWPVTFHTITTSPQNTHAVLPALKADMDDPYLAELSVGALRAYLAGADDLTNLRPTSPQGEDGAKAGRVLSGVNEQDIDEAVNVLLAASEKLRTVLARARERNQST